MQKSCPTRKRVGAGVYAGNVMATAVCETAGARRLFMDQVDRMDLMDNVGAPRDNPRVGSAAVGWDAGGRCAVGENKTNSAARLEESAAVPTGKSVRDF